MVSAIQTLKTENDFLKNKLYFQSSEIEQLNTKVADLQHILLHRDQMITLLQERYRLAIIQRYARSSDSYVDPNAPKQDDLFVEPNQPEPPEELPSMEAPENTPSQKAKARGKRKPLPEGLERVEIIHALPESELKAPEGEVYVEMGREITEQLDIVPAEVRVLQHIRLKYAVLGREELGIKIAPLALSILNKSIISPGLLAHAVQAKYEYHLSLCIDRNKSGMVLMWRFPEIHCVVPSERLEKK